MRFNFFTIRDHRPATAAIEIDVSPANLKFRRIDESGRIVYSVHHYPRTELRKMLCAAPDDETHLTGMYFTICFSAVNRSVIVGIMETGTVVKRSRGRTTEKAQTVWGSADVYDLTAQQLSDLVEPHYEELRAYHCSRSRKCWQIVEDVYQNALRTPRLSWQDMFRALPEETKEEIRESIRTAYRAHIGNPETRFDDPFHEDYQQRIEKETREKIEKEFRAAYELYRS